MNYIIKLILGMLKFLESNYLYLLWFIVYFTIAWLMFGADLPSFIFVSIIYGISITIALSPIGEFILRTIENCREPVTQQEKDYLLPMFEEVYENAKEVYPELNNSIKIYINDEMHVNAYAIGRKTIAITAGALATFSAEELKGIIAHEFGHLMHGHTKALLLSVIGNLIFSILILFFRLMFWIVQIITQIASYFSWLGVIFAIMNFMASWTVEIAVFLFMNLSQIILSLNSRTNEYQADTFAYEIGYGRELTDALYLIQKISMNAKLTLTQRLKASHPHTAKRIENLEQLEEQENEELEDIATVT